MKEIIFDPQAIEDFSFWVKNNNKIAKNILQLIKELPKAPYTGIGKPEDLKYELQDCWSRRINIEHRLIYKVTKNHIRILSCRYHY